MQKLLYNKEDQYLLNKQEEDNNKNICMLKIINDYE